MQEKAVAEEKKIGMTETWLRKHRLQFIAATRHPMLKSIRDGTINLAFFKTWLVKYNFPSSSLDSICLFLWSFKM
ncbi:putative hem oxygenase-like, multi-helical [Lupinus albus]|uniref:Putative hem oxygenase-like, multi-helical n=1 Tax=Lupinus albus TaxID=3870 RepID=A0A6A4NR31_LUPAL|nr:putative hem oxygenase-like, multi-helical [Lupinus albus]